MHKTQIAIVAAGCFWGVQAYFDQVPGVVKTQVGYTGGTVPHPTYEQVCTHTTGHAEAVKIMFDPSKISYPDLLRHFYRMHDPTQVDRQGPDVGSNYRSAIFFIDDQQQQIAKQVTTKVAKGLDKPIATQITKAAEFYLAEDYHQKYFERTGMGACHVPYAPLSKE